MHGRQAVVKIQTLFKYLFNSMGSLIRSCRCLYWGEYTCYLIKDHCAVSINKHFHNICIFFSGLVSNRRRSA